MTKREKIKILKGMRDSLTSGTNGCFCYAYMTAIKNRHILHWEAEDEIIKIGLIKPKRLYEGLMWYPETPAGIETRIRKIDELIKKLSK